jgi:opacity protein-like surface antigen
MREGIDREGIVSRIVGNNALGGHQNDAEYLSMVLKAQYRFNPKWSVFAEGMLDNEGFSKSNGVIEKGKYRTAYGYLAGVEFYPIKNSNLHFYLTYVGRHYSYTDRAKAFGADDYSTNRISLGYIWQLPMF